jgi:hypothetical protein
MRQLDAVAMGEALQALRKLILTGHPRTVHQHRDHRHLALQGGGYLEHNEVVGVIQATLAGSAGDGCPCGSNDGKQHSAVGDVLLDGLQKIDPGRMPTTSIKTPLAPNSRVRSSKSLPASPSVSSRR